MNMDQRKQRRELSEEIRIIDKHGKGKGYKTISKQLAVPVTTFANIKKFKVHGTVANLPGHGHKRKIDPRLNRRIVRMVEKEPRITAKEMQAELQGEEQDIHRDKTLKMSCFSKKEGDSLLPAEENPELRIVLLGMVGVGKSFSGNTILGNDLFHSKRSLSAVTEKCQKEMRKINNQNVVVVDTPGLLNIDQTEEEIMREIKKSINLAEPGPHVFLIVLSVKERYTKKEEEMVKSIHDTFGKNTMDYTMVLFTNGEEGTKIEDFFSGNKNLHELIKKCKYGYHLLDSRPEQVPELLKKITDKVQAAEGRYYTAEMLQEAETALKTVH
ncbi:GTPase IMAP family member 7-like [Perca fluviatilis]|uniref:GTPase IMAP family member 7-like n=1 Tax=Perca fluviatilis TaxID=8168 RepID=UPI0019625B7D|nr:GTPase IMAP family member 7-like [Perca fluviatilis]